jgi:hypothetical protein
MVKGGAAFKNQHRAACIPSYEKLFFIFFIFEALLAPNPLKCLVKGNSISLAV